MEKLIKLRSITDVLKSGTLLRMLRNRCPQNHEICENLNAYFALLIEADKGKS